MKVISRIAAGLAMLGAAVVIVVFVSNDRVPVQEVGSIFFLGALWSGGCFRVIQWTGKASSHRQLHLVSRDAERPRPSRLGQGEAAGGEAVHVNKVVRA